RGDIKTRFEAYRTGINNSWMSANEIRKMENLDPLPGEQGDTYWMPVNMAPVERHLAGEIGAPPQRRATDGQQPDQTPPDQSAKAARGDRIEEFAQILTRHNGNGGSRP
ncbi:MAG: hypothetical protein ABIL01_34090, partial [Pseudomonadota bacterium]